MVRRVLGSVVCAVSMAACSESVFEHACEHMSEAGEDVSAVRPEEVASAPGTSTLHKRYVVRIPTASGGSQAGSNVGVTRFTPAAAGDIRFLLSAKVPFEVELGGAALKPEETVDAAEGECAALVTARTYPLEAKTYVLRFGPTTAGSVDLLVEEADH